jgi:hypothetical protein
MPPFHALDEQAQNMVNPVASEPNSTLRKV